MGLRGYSHVVLKVLHGCGEREQKVDGSGASLTDESSMVIKLLVAQMS